MKKTITLYVVGKGKQLFLINEKFWDKMMELAVERKQWAKSLPDPKGWLARACEVSRKMYHEYVNMSLEDIAIDFYRYFFYRAFISTPKPFQYQIDAKAYADWVEITGIKPEEYIELALVK